MHPPSPEAIAFAAGERGRTMTGSALPRRPGFLRPDDSFYLAPDVPMDGAIPVSEAVTRLLADWQQQVAAERIASETLDTHTAVVRTFATYLAACGCDLVCDVSSEVVWQWVNSPATGMRAAASVTSMVLPSHGR